MFLDRSRALRAFAGYAAGYNAADPKVKLKIDHTYRVAALCERIAVLHGTHLIFESTPGAGTAVTLTLTKAKEADHETA